MFATTSTAPASSKRSRPTFPNIGRTRRRQAVLAELLAGEDAWAAYNERGDLARESGFGFLSARAMRAVRADGWEG